MAEDKEATKKSTVSDTSNLINTEHYIMYEWVVTMSEGEEAVLSEGQHDQLVERLKSGEMGIVFFPQMGFDINPVHIVSMIKRPVQWLKIQFPCKTCRSSGQDHKTWKICKTCRGSGVQFPE